MFSRCPESRIQTEFRVADVASDKRQVFKRRNAWSLRRRLRVVGDGSRYRVTNDDQQSYGGIHCEDALDHTTVDQVTRRLLDRQLTGCCCRHARPAQQTLTLLAIIDSLQFQPLNGL